MNKHYRDFTTGDEITCPYCDYEHSESFRLVPIDEDTPDFKCDGCSKLFDVAPQVSVEYECWKVSDKVETKENV